MQEPIFAVADVNGTLQVGDKDNPVQILQTRRIREKGLDQDIWKENEDGERYLAWSRDNYAGTRLVTFNLVATTEVEDEDGDISYPHMEIAEELLDSGQELPLSMMVTAKQVLTNETQDSDIVAFDGQGAYNIKVTAKRGRDGEVVLGTDRGHFEGLELFEAAMDFNLVPVQKARILTRNRVADPDPTEEITAKKKGKKKAKA